MYSHIPVLLQEVLEYLDPKSGQNFVDGTLGGGGYTKAILEKISPDGKVLAIDLDQAAIDEARNKSLGTSNLVLVHGNFRDIDQMVTTHKFGNISGIVADIGLSSFQLDGSGRGISFQKQEPLDMRFDLSDNSTDAKFIVNNWEQAQLTEVFRKYGEEKYASQIARKIVQHRQLKLLHYTTDLVAIIQEALPAPEKHRFADSARRIFQALRITVNHELENLETFLPKAFDLLAEGGKLAIVSFHSLEDRIVKEYFLSLARGCICPIDFPQCICGQTPKGKILTKKPITAKTEELDKNPRSKPAKLRVIEKV